MAGGVGSRFWPKSTAKNPKQFLDVLGIGKSLLRLTFERMQKISPNENIYILTNENYLQLVLSQLPELTEDQVICEPRRKNTAPCIAYASAKIYSKNKDAVLVITPSDHLILDANRFVELIQISIETALSEDKIVTLGILPTRPDTGYGYIQFVKSDKVEVDKRIKKVKTFTEKPDHDMANFFVKSGDFLWNSGIFVWSTQSIIEAMEKNDSELANLFKEGWDIYNTSKEEEFINRAYAVCKNISIDYSVMEKATNVYVRSSIFGWSDLGTWGSLHEQIEKDKNNNAIVGRNIITYDCNNCIVQVPKEKLVVLQGLEDFIVVESEGVLMICKKQDEQQIRNFVNDVKVKKGEKFV